MGFRNPITTATDPTARQAAANAQAAANSAIAAAGDAQATADGKVRAYFQTTAPTGLVPGDVGDLWFDTANGNRMSRWSGTAWVLSDDTRIAAAVTAAGNAQTTANSKVITYYQTTAPASTGQTTGNLWVNTADANRLYRWSGTAWVDVSLSRLTTTTTSGGAGVIIAGARATWQDGVGGSGYIEASSSGGGSIAGSSFTVAGPAGAATGPPMVRQRLQDAPAGGYLSVLELDADLLRLQGDADEILTPTYLANYTDGGNVYVGLRVYRQGKRGLLAGSFLYTGGGSATAGTQYSFGQLPAGMAVPGYSTAPMVVSTGAAWALGMSMIGSDGALYYVPITGPLANSAAGGRAQIHHEFRIS